MPIEYRAGFDVDDVALSRLHSAAFADSTDPTAIALQPWRSRLERHSVSWVGAFDEHRLVGFVHACWDGDQHAFLLDTVVIPSHRRRGLGTAMIRLLIEDVTRAGCRWLHVDFESHLESFYRASGFGPTGAGLMRLA